MPIKPTKFNQLTVNAKSAEEAEVLIYGSVGGGFFSDGISAKEVQKELKNLPKTIKEITVRINSPGGDVFEGWSIYNLLKQHPAKVTTKIDGMAASIASVIALAGDSVVMGEGAQLMIHSAWTFAAGNARDFENVIDRLLTIDDQLIKLYVAKTKKPVSEIQGLVHAETWFTADEAIEIGLADEKEDYSFPIAASVLDKATWINKLPKNLVTQDQVVREEVSQLQNKIKQYLARK